MAAFPWQNAFILQYELFNETYKMILLQPEFAEKKSDEEAREPDAGIGP